MQLNPGERAELQQALDALRRIVRTLRTSSRSAEHRLGVTGAQLFVLRSLVGARAMSINELAECTRTHQSTVSVVVKRLVLAGFVARSVSGADGRRLELSVTTEGRTLLRKAPQAAQEVLIAGFEQLPKAVRSRLAADLGRLVEAMRLDKQLPTMFFEEATARRHSRRSKLRDG